MSVLLVEHQNSNFYRKLFSSLVEVHCFEVSKDMPMSAYELALKLNESWNEEPVIILPLCLTSFGFPKLQDCWGLELLKEIRATKSYCGVPNRLQMLPVALLSELPLKKALALNPGNLLAVSPGTAFIGVPDDLQELDLGRIAKSGVSSLAELEPFFQVDFTPPEDRHGYSNYYAACQSLKFYCAMFPKSVSQEHLQKLLSQRSRAVRAAQFLYGQEVFESSDIRKAKGRLKFLREGLFRLESPLNPVPKKIGLIDDQASQITGQVRIGWAAIYNRLLYGSKHSLTLIPSNGTPNAIAQVMEEDFEVILLDLHLELGDSEKPAFDTKGAAVLRCIRERFPMLPIIMTTASRDPEKRKALRNLGCDGYWLKEGIDERLSPGKSIERQLDLVEMLVKVTNEDYGLLTTCHRLLGEMAKEKMWWEGRRHYWETGFTGSKTYVNVDKPFVIERLRQALFLARSFLQNKIMGEGYRRMGDDMVWITGIVVPLGGILESIHQVEKSGFKSNIMQQRFDYLGNLLYRLRNQAAHLQLDVPLDFMLLSTFLKGIFCYLMVTPDEYQNSLKFGSQVPTLEELIGKFDRYRAFYVEHFLYANPIKLE